MGYRLTPRSAESAPHCLPRNDPTPPETVPPWTERRVKAPGLEPGRPRQVSDAGGTIPHLPEGLHGALQDSLTIVFNQSCHRYFSLYHLLIDFVIYGVNNKIIACQGSEFVLSNRLNDPALLR